MHDHRGAGAVGDGVRTWFYWFYCFRKGLEEPAEEIT